MIFDHTLPTIKAIYAHYERARKNSHRPHLGASQIGNPCNRALWYQFRWCDSAKFDGRMLRLFETGDREEDRLIANLRAVGVEVWSRDPETGRQFNYVAHGGHFGASLDAVGLGFVESKKPHLIEFKTVNAKGFKELSTKGVEAWKPVYWAQMHVGMYLADLERAYFLAVEKDTDAIYGERVRLDKALAMQLLAKAETVIFSDQPPARIANDPSDFRCKFCAYFKICHQAAPPEVNCRSCAHITPEKDGTWTCAKHKKLLSTDDQRAACADHLINPYVVDRWEVTDAADDWIEFTTPHGEVIRNAGNSKEIREGWEL